MCTLLELVPCSPQLALRVQVHELCARVCPILVLTAYLHPQGPVFDLMCVPTVMHAKKVQSKCRPACCDSNTCRSPYRAVLSLRDASSQQQGAGMQLCSSNIKFNFLLIANMQQHKRRSRNGLAFPASPNPLAKVHRV